MGNTFKTTLLLGAMTALFVVVGGALGGEQGMILMLVIAGAMNLGTWWFSDRIVLRTSGAIPVDDLRSRGLYHPAFDWLEADVADLAERAGIPAPQVFVVPNEPSPNAFATGRSPDKGVVAVTAGLLQTLDRREVRGVLAHELGHIAHRDTLISAVVATMAGAVTMLAGLARWSFLLGGGVGGGDDEGGVNPIALLVTAIVAPIAAAIVHMAVSRTREYAADARAARITGDPEGLARALEGLVSRGSAVPMHGGNKATHYIVNNFAGTVGRLLQTHPPMEERVRRLRALATG